MEEPSFGWSGSCQFNKLDGVDLKPWSSWSSKSNPIRKDLALMRKENRCV